VTSPEFKIATSAITPTAPVLVSYDVANTLTASHVLGSSEILVSVNNGTYVAYSGQINVGNVDRPFGYWQFKIKAAQLRNESSVVKSSAFTFTTTPKPPILVADDKYNTLIASHEVLYFTQILVSENNGDFKDYTGKINVYNIARPKGYWKFKTEAGLRRNESEIVESPAFTFSSTPAAPNLSVDDKEDTISVYHLLGSSEIVVSENNGTYRAYTGKINVGNVARPFGYWKFKIKAAEQRLESDIVQTPAFTITTTPNPPVLTADDVYNTLIASHDFLYFTQLLVSENNGDFTAYTGKIQVYNVARPAGYWKFKTAAGIRRNESEIAESPAFTFTTTPAAPQLLANDETNTITVFHELGLSEILVSENDGAYVSYSGQINIGNVDRPFGYWKFKIKAAQQRYESSVVKTPAFTITTTPNPPVLTADDVYNTLIASHDFLYFTQLLVSENNGDFKAYTGKIQVYNVARPAGYWKFKTAAGLRRNESAVVASPAFTVKAYASRTANSNKASNDNVTAASDTNNSSAVNLVEANDVAGERQESSNAGVNNIPANDYPRINSVDKSGKIRFTGIDFGKNINEKESFVVFPNPIVSKNIFIKCGNVAEGVYAISLISSNGQTIIKKSLNHPGGPLTHSISLSATLANGIYLLQFSGKNVSFNKQLVK
jgi:hypothetical protein